MCWFSLCFFCVSCHRPEIKQIVQNVWRWWNHFFSLSTPRGLAWPWSSFHLGCYSVKREVKTFVLRTSTSSAGSFFVFWLATLTFIEMLHSPVLKEKVSALLDSILELEQSSATSRPHSLGKAAVVKAMTVASVTGVYGSVGIDFECWWSTSSPHGHVGRHFDIIGCLRIVC